MAVKHEQHSSSTVQTQHLPHKLPSLHPLERLGAQCPRYSNVLVSPTMFRLLRKRRCRWLGHVHQMEDGRRPKDILYSCMNSPLARELLVALNYTLKKSANVT